MACLNSVQLIGYLGCDPTDRATRGKPVTNFSLATTEKYEKEGEKREETEWHQIVAWGPLAEVCKKHLRKGRQVFVSGRLRARSYEASDGEKHLTTEIVARTILFLGKKDD